MSPADPFGRTASSTKARFTRSRGGSAGLTEFHTGDVRSLEFGDASFDVVVAHTLLSHVQDPLVVLQEAARVLKAGGRIGVLAPPMRRMGPRVLPRQDYQSLTL